VSQIIALPIILSCFMQALAEKQANVTHVSRLEIFTSEVFIVDIRRLANMSGKS